MCVRRVVLALLLQFSPSSRAPSGIKKVHPPPSPLAAAAAAGQCVHHMSRRWARQWLVAVRRALRRLYHAVALRAVDLAGLACHVAQHLHRGLVRRAQRDRPLLQAYLVLRVEERKERVSEMIDRSIYFCQMGGKNSRLNLSLGLLVSLL